MMEARCKVCQALLLIFCGFFLVIGHQTVMETMEWKFSRRLYEYRHYAAITLERIDIPLHTIFANLTFNAFSTSDSCSVKNVKVFAKQHGIPVVSRDNETFPDNAYVPIETQNITMKTNNETTPWVLQELQKGSLFLMFVFPDVDTRIRQKGLGGECNYFITIQAKMCHYQEDSVPMLPIGDELLFKGTSTSIASFRLPIDTQSYILQLHGCQEPCPVNVLVSESPSLESGRTDCTWKNTSCTIQMDSAYGDSFNYLTFSSSSQEEYAFRLKLLVNLCNKMVIPTNTSSLRFASEDQSCSFLAELNRETPSDENQGSNFYDHFAFLDPKTSLPMKLHNIQVSDKNFTVLRIKLQLSDTGASLNIILQSPIIEGTLDATIDVCISKHRILKPENCSKASVLSVKTSEGRKTSKLMYTYPESGVWYFILHSRCFGITANERCDHDLSYVKDCGGGVCIYINHNWCHKNNITVTRREANKDMEFLTLPISSPSSNTSVPCTSLPLVNMTVGLASCVEGKCGKYGSCKLYTGADILFSACDCHSGWRGYGCNDGSKASSEFNEKLAVYLLTLSNLGFIPGIVVAIHGKFFVEALVYAFNMFFSTFYHACDSSQIYQLCILHYNALSFADFLASLLSFAVTLLAMARIPTGLRSFLHMLMALFISLGEVYNRHGLLEQLLPIASGVTIVIISWILQMYKRKALFPSRRRYILFLLPGLCMSILGLVINLAISTQENYKYVHSAWHLLESLAIVFLLPPAKRMKDEINSGLSVQSGDVVLPTNDINLVDEQGASLQDPGESSPLSGSSSTVRQSLTFKGRIKRIIGQRKRRQNFIL